MKILVTGFDPFDNETVNPTIEVVKRLPEQIGTAEIIQCEVPTEFQRSISVIKAAIKKYHPDYVVNIGQAGGRSGITPERVAINLDDGRIPDNAGDQPMDQPIYQDGPAAYFTQLPVKAMVAAIKAVGVPSYPSNTAGTYVCNHIMYAVQYMRDKEFPKLKAGFIHIPYLPSQVPNNNLPSLSLEQAVKGIKAALKVLVNNK